ncbi:MAG: hypothetical protein AB1696_00810 [Planctomycetota bacterium]
MFRSRRRRKGFALGGELRKMRRCLSCDRMFMSSGPGNRRCRRCAKELANVTPGRTARCVLTGVRFLGVRDSELVQDLLSEED